MKALLLTQYKQLEYVDFPDPEYGPDDLLVKVHACGICGSDIHGFDGSSFPAQWDPKLGIHVT